MDSRLLKTMFSGMTGDANNHGSRIAAHLPTLYALAMASSGNYIVECGVNRGWSTIALLAGASHGSKQVTSYDNRAECKALTLRSIGLNENDPHLSSWTFKVSDSVLAAADWPDASIGLWFLDTLHAYDQTSKELEAWLTKIAPNGIMCGHDYLLHERWGRPQAEVDRAVQDFLKANNGRFCLQLLPHDDGLFILWPI